MELPEKVMDTFEMLKREYGGKLILKRLNGEYLVLERRPKRLLDSRLYANPYVYIARITDSGLVVPARHRTIGKKEIDALLGKGISKISTDTEYREARENATDINIIKFLSSYGRASAKSVGAAVGLKPTAAFYRVSKLEDRYGIRRVVELDMLALGYSRYILFAKFENKMPETDKIRTALKDIKEIQLGLVTTGRFDLVLYLFAKNSRDVAFLMKRIATSTELKNYDIDFNLTPYYMSFGIQPTDPDFVGSESMKENVWIRRKGSTKPMPNQITSREYELIRVMAKDGNMRFADIDRITGMAKGTSRHTYERLLGKGIIKMVSIGMSNPDVKYNAVILTRFINGRKMEASMESIAQDIVEEKGIVNKYVMVGDIASPYGIIRVMPVFHDGDVGKEVDRLNDSIKGAQSEGMVVSDVVKGEINYRNIDMKLSKQYKLLEKRV